MPDVTKTVGSSGRDYSTWTLWEAAIDNTTYPAANTNAIGEGYDDSVFDENLTLNAIPSNLDRATVTVASGERHDGTAGTGCRMVRSAINASWDLSPATTDGRDIAWMELSGNNLTGSAGAAVRLLSIFSSNCLARARRCIIHNINGNSAAADVNLVRLAGATGSTLNNCIIYNLDNVSVLSSTAHTSGVNSQTSASLFLDLANCVIDNIHTANTGSSFAEGVQANDVAALKIRNTIVTDVVHDGGGTDNCFQNSSWTNATVSHNASSDTTASGTGSIDEVVRANEFVSVTEGMEDYGLLTGAQSFEAGTDLVTTPFEVNLDLTGYNRDAGGDTWSIGAVQAESGTPVNTITITSPDAHQIYQRNISTDLVNVTVSGGFSGALDTVEYRLTPVSTGTPGSWIDLGATVGGTWSGVIENLPIGQYTIEVRNADDTAVTASVAMVGVGDVFLAMGQSNANGHVANQLNYSHAHFEPGYWKLASTSWAEFDPTAGNNLAGEYSPWGPFATAWMAEHSVPVGFILTAVHGTAIASWLPAGSNNNYDNMLSAIASSGVNSVLAALWLQGETDALAGVSRASYHASEELIALGLLADVAGDPRLISCHCADAGNDDAVQAIRLAKQDGWDDDNVVAAGASFHDFLSGNLSTDAGVNLFATRLTTILTDKLFDGGTGRGPKATVVTINDAKTLLTVYVNKDTAVPGSNYGAAGWTATDDGVSAPIASVVRSAVRQIAVTLSSAAAGTVALSFGEGSTAVGIVVPKDSLNLPLETFSDIEALPIGGSEAVPSTPFARPWG